MFKKLWEMPGLFFAPDEGGGAGTGINEDDAGKQDEPDENEQPDDAAGNKGGESPEFTPEQKQYIESLMVDRLKRDRAAQAKKAEAAKAAEVDEAEKKRLAEQEEWKALAEKREQAEAAAQAARDDALAQLQEERVGREIERVAAGLDFHDAKDAFDLIDMAAVQVDEDGKVAGVEKALKKLAEDKPYLVQDENGKNGRKGTPLRGRQLQQQGKQSTPRGEQVRNTPTRVPSL